MHQIKRKILFFVFTAAFFIISPIMIFYTSGYKLDWKNPLSFYFIQKTGMLIVESNPTGADIYLNGKQQKNLSLNFKILKGGESIKTPTKIKNLLPGSYDLRIERNGYWSWERRVKVLPGQITHVLDIRLFKHELPTLSLSNNDESIKISPDGKKIILLPSAEIFEIKNEETTKISSSSQSYALWSPDSSKIILPEEIINLKSPKKNISLSSLLGKNFSQIKWGRSSEEIIYLFKNELSRLNLQNQTAQIILNEVDIKDFLAKKNDIAIISASSTQAELKIFSIDKGKLIQKIDLPFSDEYYFVNEENKFFNVLDKKHSILYIIDSSSGEIKKTINNCLYSDWFNDSILFYGNDFEIWEIDFTQNTHRLLTRVSENKISKVLTTATDNYILYFTDKNANVLTWDKGEETIQPTELLNLDRLSSPVFNSENGTIYFLGKIGNQQGLYKLYIR